MSTEYSYPHTDFANDTFNEDALKQQVAADTLITKDLDYIKSAEAVDGNGDPTGNITIMFGFAEALPAGDKTALDALVAAHDGNPPTQVRYHASSTILHDEQDVTDADWTVLGGVVTTPEFFCPSLACIKARIIGSYNTNGAGAEVRIVEDGTTVLGTFALPDSSQAWAQMQWFTTTQPTSGTHEYTLEAKRGTATAAKVRFVSMSLLEFYQ
jgi:hypothetical protein